MCWRRQARTILRIASCAAGVHGESLYHRRLQHLDSNQHGGTDGHGNSDFLILITIGGSFGIIFIFLACCFTYKGLHKAWMDWIRTIRLRVLLHQGAIGWECGVCYHANDVSETVCVLCGTKQHKPDRSRSRVRESKGDVEDADFDYQVVSTPRETRTNEVDEWNERQNVAFLRHEWKRCVSSQGVRWVHLERECVQSNQWLRATIVSERDVAVSERQGLWNWVQSKVCRRREKEEEDASLSLTEIVFDSHKAFVRDVVPGKPLLWIPAEEARTEYTISLRVKELQRVSQLPFMHKVRWIGHTLNKMNTTPADGYHTIRVHREHVLKQSQHLFLTAPAPSLRRRLRVDFMEEPGVDGGGILREWLYLITTDLFSSERAVFVMADSGAHPGYWLNRLAYRQCRNHLQMLVFFGKVLGKAIMEGLVLNVRLSVPLLKHLLGAPVSLVDMKLLDEQIYSSLVWILENDGTDALGLNFTVDGTPLVPDGTDTLLDDTNKHDYVQKVVQYYLFDSVRAELGSLLEGLRSVVPEGLLHVLDHKELDLVLSGLPKISLADWRANTSVRMLNVDVDMETQVVEWFWQVLDTFTPDGHARLLQYVTGSSGVPVGGFQALTGMDGELQPFTIGLLEYDPHNFAMLPRASTCLNRLDLPVYETKKEVDDALTMLIQMDVTGFNRS